MLAHILREAKFEANSPLTRLLYERLQDLFWEAGGLQPGAPVDLLVARTRAVAEEYKDLDISFGTTPENAAENLYTFVRYPGMDPTNNESERMLCKVVTRRKIRQKSVAAEGMRRFGVRLSCMLTWRKRGHSVYDMMQDVLGSLKITAENTAKSAIACMT